MVLHHYLPPPFSSSSLPLCRSKNPAWARGKGEDLNWLRDWSFGIRLAWVFYYLFKEIFIYLAASGLSCSTQDLCCLTFLVVECRIFSCGMRDLVPWPGIEFGPLALGVQSLSYWPVREVPVFYYLKKWVELPRDLRSRLIQGQGISQKVCLDISGEK